MATNHFFLVRSWWFGLARRQRRWAVIVAIAAALLLPLMIWWINVKDQMFSEGQDLNSQTGSDT